MIYIGTAGWTIPAAASDAFSAAGTHLQRYAGHFSGTEINSTFYRAHKPSTYARWVESVPETFKFSVKLPREITHEQQLVDVASLLEIFLLQATLLGEKLGCLLVQLPPSLAFNSRVSTDFLEALRHQFAGPVAFEPRHATWFAAEPTELLTKFRISRVGSDPAVMPDAAIPGAFDQFVYLRLHGSPRMYYSAYDEHAIQSVASVLMATQARGADAWCVFDNTASGAAASDALRLQNLLRRQLSEFGSHSRF